MLVVFTCNRVAARLLEGAVIPQYMVKCVLPTLFYVAVPIGCSTGLTRLTVLCPVLKKDKSDRETKVGAIIRLFLKSKRFANSQFKRSGLWLWLNSCMQTATVF